MRISGLPDRVFATAVTAAALAAMPMLSGCDRIKQRLQGEQQHAGAAEKTAAEPKVEPSAPVASPPTAPPASGPTELALDIDGDGRADSVRIARVGHFAVDDPVAVQSDDGTIVEPVIDWEKDAIVIKLASGREVALNFPHVQSLALIRPGSRGAADALSLGCTPDKEVRGLLAKAEEGSVVVHLKGGRIVAQSCGE